MDGLSSVDRPLWKPHHRQHGYSPPASFSALGPPPEAWNTRGQVRSPRPQAALEGVLAPLLAPSFPSPASLPRSDPEPAWTSRLSCLQASSWMPARGTGKTDEGQEESSVSSNCPRQGHHESSSGYGAQRRPLLTGLPAEVWCEFPAVRKLWMLHLGQASWVSVDLSLSIICLLKSLPLTLQGPSDFSQDPERRSLAASI